MRNNRLISKAWFMICSLVLLAGAFGVGYMFNSNKGVERMELYTHDNIDFSFYYPSDFSVHYNGDLKSVIVVSTHKVPCTGEGNSDPVCMEFASFYIAQRGGITVDALLQQAQEGEGYIEDLTTRKIGEKEWAVYRTGWRGGFTPLPHWVTEFGDGVIDVWTRDISSPILKDDIEVIIGTLTSK